MREILGELVASIRARRELVFCAVVETRGSTPQKAGAAMLVFPDGRQVGTLGGGCVEAEVKQRALRSLADGRPTVMTYQLDDNYGWDDGLICGGRMTMLVDPVTHRDSLDYFGAFHELVEQGSGGTEVVVLDEEKSKLAPPGARWLFDTRGELVASRHATGCSEAVRAGVTPLADRPRPEARGGLGFLPHLPRCRLVIVGGGHVGQAVGRLAVEADFDVWVVDDRAAYANAERFPGAERLIVGEVSPTLAELEITPNTYCLIVTRGHQHDEEALEKLAQRGARYVGMIGSKRKIRLIFDDLIAAGISPDALDQVHAPLGFDIGSQTVAEIAISIMAELIAHRNLGASPEHLRRRRERIERQANPSTPHRVCASEQ
jgi:xanthine dehydrogenase accessory factor